MIEYKHWFSYTENRGTLGEISLIATLLATNPRRTDLDSNAGLYGEIPAADVSHGTASDHVTSSGRMDSKWERI